MIDRLFGRIMRGYHAGDHKLIWNQPPVRLAPETILLTSSAFQEGAEMPKRYAAKAIGGDNQSPPLEWLNLPSRTAEIALVMEDPDAPIPVTSLHLVATGISSNINALSAGALNSGTQSSLVRLGKGHLGRGYYGAAPPPSHGPHRYIFQIFALGQPLRTDIVFNRKSLLKEIDGKVIARGKLVGTFERK
jgi:Raf kinase inhibitor-like YbhB/YbcL family protein